jgi:formylglycine-generating enzyme required for sulfatase activity
LNTKHFSSVISQITAPPFEWCVIDSGLVSLEDASGEGGSIGGSETVAPFWMARYPVTNAQFQGFTADPDGYRNPLWWEFSPQARQWHVDHPNPRATAFPGDLLPRTRVNWFESMAFCNWLTVKISGENDLLVNWVIRLPTEQEWQRAAVGDTGWVYPWGNTLSHAAANYGSQVGRPTPVDQFQQGQSPCGVLDMIGNVWERCLSAWGKEPAAADLTGYTYRVMRGGAWNISKEENLSAHLRYGHPPRGQLNDAGFRVVYGQPLLMT